MTGQELLDYLRTDILRDSAVPYLWSDDMIFRLLGEAENKFARETYALLDDSLTITTAAGTASYALPTGTLFVESAAISTSAHDLGNYTRRFLPSNLTTASGTPTVFACDQSARTIRFYPVPDAIITINLRVARLPLTPIGAYSSPEIPEEYHMDLAEYVAWRCQQSNDADGESLGAADRHKKDWLLRVADAKREYYRARMGNNPNATRNWTGMRK